MALGDGFAMSSTDRFKGSKAMAKGEKGSKNSSGWGGHSDSFSDTVSIDNWDRRLKADNSSRKHHKRSKKIKTHHNIHKHNKNKLK